jgi:hypothetical protein
MSHGRRALSRLYHRMNFRASAIPDLEKIKDSIDWLEAQDFNAFLQLFRSVRQMKGDFDETRAEMLKRDRTFK